MGLLRPPIEWEEGWVSCKRHHPKEALTAFALFTLWALMTVFTVYLNVVRAFGFPVTIPAKGSSTKPVVLTLER
jgi:hypothetical protein